MDTFLVDGWNNFCRVFQLPRQFPSSFCFGGGVPVQMIMVDWFDPVPDVARFGVTKEHYLEHHSELPTPKAKMREEIVDKLVPFISQKNYVKEGESYLVICDFGLSFVFGKDGVKVG